MLRAWRSLPVSASAGAWQLLQRWLTALQPHHDACPTCPACVPFSPSSAWPGALGRGQSGTQLPPSTLPGLGNPTASLGARSYGSRASRKRFYEIPEHLVELLKQPEKPAPQRVVPPLEPRPYTTTSRRTGVIAVKVGMTQEWNEWGVRVPLTVMWMDDCQVVRVKVAEYDNVTSVQLGAGYKRSKSLHPSLVQEFLNAQVPNKRMIREFKVTPDALLPCGTLLTAAHFVAGQFVDVCGISKGKGFQGVMKRWGFKGQPASHGVSLAHRSAGSTGNRNDPGKIWRGKKMPGRMGAERVTVQGCFMYKVDPARNLLYVRGTVPGNTGSFLLVRDALRKPHSTRQNLPFPTFLGDELPPVTTAAASKDPYHVYRADVDYFEEDWKGGD